MALEAMEKGHGKKRKWGPMPSRLDTLIETPRLILRVPSLEEFEAWCAFSGEIELA